MSGSIPEKLAFPIIAYTTPKAACLTPSKDINIRKSEVTGIMEVLNILTTPIYCQTSDSMEKHTFP